MQPTRTIGLPDLQSANRRTGAAAPVDMSGSSIAASTAITSHVCPSCVRVASRDFKRSLHTTPLDPSHHTHLCDTSVFSFAGAMLAALLLALGAHGRRCNPACGKATADERYRTWTEACTHPIMCGAW